jgi:hypothetical protein
MKLIGAGQGRTGKYRLYRPPPVFADGRRIVACTPADIEPRDLALGEAAAAPEEAMRHFAQRRRADDFDLFVTAGISQGCG